MNRIKEWLTWVIPVALLISAYVLMTNYQHMPSAVLGITPYGAYIVIVIAMLLAYWFNRSRVFFVLLMLLLSHVVLSAVSGNDAEVSGKIYSLLFLLLPLNLLGFYFLKERGIFSIWGIIKFLVLLFQFAAGYILIKSTDPIVNAAFNFHRQVLGPGGQEFVALPALLVFIIVLAVFTGRFIRDRNYFNSSLVLILFTLIIVYWFRATPLSNVSFFMACGLILIISVIQDSYSMAYIDELTRLPGRRAFNEDLLKLSGGYVIAMVDIDHFKQFNDKHGHDVGDDVLRMVASKLQNVRGGGKAYRYGGEEFTIVFAGKNLDDAIGSLEELREKIAGSQFIVRGKDRPQNKPEKIHSPKKQAKKLSVTVSVGAACRSKENHRPTEVLKAADVAMYRAKKGGRNRVCS